MTPVARPSEGAATIALRGACRLSFYANLLGLKIPIGLLVRASRAKHSLAFLVCAVVPFNVLCHLLFLPMIREATVHGQTVWQLLLAMWITIPLVVVGSVILTSVRDPKMCAAFLSALAGVICIHRFLVPAVQPTLLGTLLLQLLFAAFEDSAIAGWIWCLYHSVKIQNHIRHLGSGSDCPIKSQQGKDDRVIIIGNAPSVTQGQPLGNEIDQFPHVVRFNGYQMDDPKRTGSSVTHHFCNGRQAPGARAVQVVTPIFNASLTHAAYLFFPRMEEARVTCEHLMSGKMSAWFVDEERILALIQKIKPNFWQIPSSGMVAIDAFLSRYPEVTLHGFNFFAGKTIHYFEESPVQLITSWLERFVTHNPAAEKQWVQSLISEGRASFLSEASAVAKSGEDDKAGGAASDENKEVKLRRRFPGLGRLLARDGFPSQFSM